MREMVRPTSAADINSRSVAPLTCDLDLLLRLAGRIVKGCRSPARLSLDAGQPKTTSPKLRHGADPTRFLVAYQSFSCFCCVQNSSRFCTLKSPAATNGTAIARQDTSNMLIVAS